MTGYAIFWLVLLVILVLIEFATAQFVTIWFAAGALVAVFLSGFPFWVQLIGFTVTSIILLILTRPLVKKLKKRPVVPTNADLDIGKTATVIQTINNSANEGRVRLNGVDWIAISVDDTIIEKDEIVIVDHIEGAKLFVKRQNN